ncbi:MAG: serine O-acetyltransferase [Alphaproteobacteria bacterium]
MTEKIENIHRENAIRWQHICARLPEFDRPFTKYIERIFASSKSLSESLARIISHRICVSKDECRIMAYEFGEQMALLEDVIWADLDAVSYRDPACRFPLEAVAFYKGFHAIAAYRVAHAWWSNERTIEARYVQSRVAEVFNVDIHPACVLGKGLMIDHAHNIVIGETARVGNDCSILHGVTLGGTGKIRGDRHPKIGNGVMIGAGAKILGNVEIGNCVRIAAGSVVTKDVVSNVTVAGVPAKIIGDAGCDEPSTQMIQRF